MGPDLPLALGRALGAEDDGAVSYGRFRNFLVLLPPERLTGMDAETAWFESATMIPLGAHSLTSWVVTHVMCPEQSCLRFTSTLRKLTGLRATMDHSS